MSGQDGDTLIDGILCPQQHGPFSRGKIINNEIIRPGTGHTIEYHHDTNTQATVYVYDNQMQNLSNDLEYSALKTEFECCAHFTIHYNASQPGYTVDGVEYFSIAVKFMSTPILCAKFFIITHSFKSVSILVLTTIRNKFIKFRITTTHINTYQKIVDMFVASFLIVNLERTSAISISTN